MRWLVAALLAAALALAGIGATQATAQSKPQKPVYRTTTLTVTVLNAARPRKPMARVEVYAQNLNSPAAPFVIGTTDTRGKVRFTAKVQKGTTLALSLWTMVEGASPAVNVSLRAGARKAITYRM